jgi:hypothetical protein
LVVAVFQESSLVTELLLHLMNILDFEKKKKLEEEIFAQNFHFMLKLALECLQAHLEMYAIKNLCLYCATGYVFISSLSLHKLYLVFFSTVEYPSVILFVFHEF